MLGGRVAAGNYQASGVLVGDLNQALRDEYLLPGVLAVSILIDPVLPLGPVAGGPSEPNKYSVDASGVEIVTGDPAAGGLYLRGLAREGVALRREILRFLTRLRSQSGRAPVDFTRCTVMLS